MMSTAFSTAVSWKRDLLKNLLQPPSLPTVTKTDFQDAKELFKIKTKQFEAKVTLRKAKRFKEEIVLPQFDPNFTSNDVICRHPSCKSRNPKAAIRDKGVKRDLYLCPSHRELLKRSICKAMEKGKVKFPMSEFASEPGRFEGYTAFISILEGAYHEARKVPTVRDTSRMVEEAILNVRNFLMITNTLLNPDDNNLELALPPVVQILQHILENQNSANKLLKSLLPLLKEIVDMILFAFGVLYTWVSLANPGTKIGAGVGGCIGAAAFALGPASGAVGVAVGGTLGGLIGCGIYMLIKESRVQQNIARARREWLAAAAEGGYSDAARAPPVMYFVSGDDNGGLTLTAAAA